jgi:hypothetical protein
MMNFYGNDFLVIFSFLYSLISFLISIQINYYLIIFQFCNFFDTRQR